METKYLEAIHELQLSLTRIAAHVESELGTPSTPGNINRIINSLKKEIDDLKKESTAPDGINAKIQKLEIGVSTLEKEIQELENWKLEMIKIASIPQFEEMKKELESQKTKWIIAGTVFTVIQIIVGIVIKFLL